MKTWQLEIAAVAVILSGSALISGEGLAGWIGVVAVVLSFGHAQVADRLAEREAYRSEAVVSCHRWAGRYLVSKELFWVAYFALHQSWSALVGVAVFLLYPVWRSWYRTLKPVAFEGPVG